MGRRRSASPPWKAEGTHRSSPTPGSATCTSSKGTWRRPSGCWSRAWPSVVPLATGPCCDGSQQPWALPMRSRGVWPRGARCWRRRSAKSIRTGGLRGLAYRVAWLSEVCLLAGRDAGGPATRAQHSTSPGSTKSVPTRRSRCTSLASSRPTPIPPMVAQAEVHYQQALVLAEELVCARSWPTATSAWARCMPRPASWSRLVLT